MISVTLIQKDTGDKETIEVPENTTLMEATRFYSKNKYVRGIEGDCGGSCSCATWYAITGPASDKTAELSLLEYEEHFEENASRLSCQIMLQKKHDGLVVYVP
jgi:2Fe-2S ferredoxin